MRWLLCSLLVAACDAGPSTTVPSSTAPAWTRVVTPGTPPARAWHSLVPDGDGRRLVLFGGQDTGGARGDLWTYDLDGAGGWTARDAPGGPSARWGHGAVVVDGTLWVFGGQSAGGLLADLWSIALDGGAWTRHDGAGAAPAVRYGVGALEHDAARGRLVVTHGFAAGGRHDDTWSFAGGAWREISPAGTRPLKRCLHDTAVDGARGVLFLHGGCSSGFGPCPQDDLWAFDLAAETWRQLGTSGAPPGRENAALVYDERGQRLLLLHGNAEPLTDEVWAYDVAADRWSRLVTGGPSPRSQADAALDPVTRRVYLFGGRTAAGVSDELWALQLQEG